MPRLKPTQDTRTTYDSQNGAVRSFFGTELVEESPQLLGAAPKAATSKAQDFLSENRDLFQLDKVTVRQTERREGAAMESLRYTQEQDTIPVYGGELVIGVEKSGKVASAVNKLDYEIPPQLNLSSVTVTADQAVAVVKERLAPLTTAVKTAPPTLYILRLLPRPANESSRPDPEKQAAIEALETGSPGDIFLTWMVPVDTEGPSGNWKIFVDATNKNIVAVRTRRRYATVKGFVYMPDPITTSGNASLSSATSETTLNAQRKEVDLENLRAAVTGTFKLEGKWATSKEIETPNFAPPSTTTDFKFGAKTRSFLSVMAYYWVDRLVTYLRDLGNPTFNAAVEQKPMPLDAQGLDGDDNSHFVVESSGDFYIAFGEGGVPDAADAHVIVHEYGHALHHLLGTSQNFNGSEEGYGDFLAGSFLDRFNTAAFQREAVFPWDNNSSSSDHYSDDRFFNTTRKFSDSNYNSLSIHVKGSVLAATLWDLYLSLGGNVSAANTINKLYMEMLIAVSDNSSVKDLAKGLVTADQALNGGANKTQIKAAFAGRGLTI